MPNCPSLGSFNILVLSPKHKKCKKRMSKVFMQIFCQNFYFDSFAAENILGENTGRSFDLQI